MSNKKKRYPDLPEWLQALELSPVEWKGVKAYFGIVPLARIRPNDGQLDGLPCNPREWTRTDIDNLKASLQETPELYVARGVLSYPDPSTETVVALGGNMRLQASTELKHEDVPAIIYPQDTPIETLKEIVIKDNGSFGAWDFAQLEENWSDKPLVEWGVDGFEAAGPGSEPEAKEDNFDKDKDEIHVICAKGDIWQLGEHRLMCGDSIELEQVKKLMGGGRS